MLCGLFIRNVVLIEQLDLSFGPGLSVFTGETGTGKSILLDALGLALGARADSGLIRVGAERADVAASFEQPPEDVAAVLQDLDIDAAEELVLRRTLGPDGRSRAFVNDMPVAAGLLRRLGRELVEVHGQFEQRGLLDESSHRGLLDLFAGHDSLVEATADAWRARVLAEEDAEAARAALARDRAAREELEAELETLDRLAPQPGEEASLAARRRRILAHRKIAEAATEARAILGDDAAAPLRGAARSLARAGGEAGGLFDEALSALDRATVEAEEAERLVRALGGRIEDDEASADAVEARLFALRDAARRYRIEVEDLPGRLEEMRRRVEMLDEGGARVAELEETASGARAAFDRAAAALTVGRREAASALAAAVGRELPPLKLDKASFRVTLEPGRLGASGADQVRFEIRTNAGIPFGALARIASGGELARFALGLKAALAAACGPTMIFDEVDAGIGGATAAAVGARLAALGQSGQVLVVTHAPQVAARASRHFQVSKDDAHTFVTALDEDGREEEIARMLAGAKITGAARRAARALILGEGG
ncbi:MAG: DNA repair protein RecN [Alphaproteobacteria bacterium]|nr:DNA repair protein RecN [Alphaproteobacteria bacterium]